jgi:hypothetical protein
MLWQTVRRISQAVVIVRKCEDELAMISMAKSCHNAGSRVTCSLIVDVSISFSHRTPEAGKPRVQKTQHRTSRIFIVCLYNAHSVNFHLTFLAMINCYETDPISSFGEVPTNDCLLHLCPAYTPMLRIVYQRSKVIQ